jgi:hypothetical protein
MARLGQMEKLARDICWAEFVVPTVSAVGCSKSAYWQKVAPDKKASYMRSAEYLVHILKKLPRKTVAKLAVDSLVRPTRLARK